MSGWDRWRTRQTADHGSMHGRTSITSRPSRDDLSLGPPNVSDRDRASYDQHESPDSRRHRRSQPMYYRAGDGAGLSRLDVLAAAIGAQTVQRHHIHGDD